MAHIRQPLGQAPLNAGRSRPSPFGSPAKLSLGDCGPERQASPDNPLARDALAVIQALEAQSPAPPSHGAGLHEVAQEGTPQDAIVPAGSRNTEQSIDTLLIRRLASDVAAADDVVAAWEQVEGLKSQLRRKDSELEAALEALAAAQAFGESPRTAAAYRETAGQQLARFLKDQLAARDAQLEATAAEAEAMRREAEEQGGALAASEARCRQLELALADTQAALQAAQAAAEQHAEAAEHARQETAQSQQAAAEQAAEAQQLRSELWALEARASLAAYNTPEADRRVEPEGSISLHQPGTSFHTAGAGYAAADGPVAGAQPGPGEFDDEEDDPDFFSSPMLNSLRREGRASHSPGERQQGRPGQAQQRGGRAAASGGSPSFQFVSAAGEAGAGDEEDGASSGGETEATVSEAAVVARTLTRASALQKDREQLRQQVRDLSHELRDMKGKQKAMAQHMQAAAEGGPGASGGRPGGLSQPRRLAPQQQSPAGEADGGGGASLEERCRLQAVEERHLRSEVDTLNRKCEKLSEVLLKANHAMKILHYKLQKERKAVGRLQEEKCGLQAHLLSGGGGAGTGAGTSQQQQLAALLHELSAGRARIEALLEERAALATRLEMVASSGDGSGRSATPEQRKAAAATLAALQHQQEATSAALREQLAAEKARSVAMGEDRAALEGRLQEALGRLGAAEQISGHLEQMNSYLQEERQRCQQLASQLGREQQGSESRAVEVARLTTLAQQATEELMGAREAAQAERSRAEQLAHDRAELQGRVEALQDTLKQLEKSDDVMLRLTEDKAALALALQDAKMAGEAASAAAEERASYAAQVEVTCAELRRQLDAAVSHQDVAHAAVEGAADQLQALTDSHEQLERQLAGVSADLAAAQRDAGQRGMAAAQLQQHVAVLDAELRQAAAQRDAALAQAQDVQRQLAATQHEATAQQRAAATATQQLEAACAEAQGLAAKLQEVQAEKARLKENLKALQAECDAVRVMGHSVDDANQTLVDNMCEMTGLVDAVQALQHRNRLLQHDLDALQSKHSELQQGHETQGRSLQAAQHQLAVAQEQAGAAQAACEEAQREAAAARVELASAHAQCEDALQKLEHAEREQSTLQGQLAGAESDLAASRQQAQQAQRQQEDAATAAAQLRQQLGEAQQQAATAAGERQEWTKQRVELQEQLAAMSKSHSVAEGKLVLARQREAQFKEASKQLRVLQQELASFVQEGAAHQEKREEAERRCTALEARCAELERSNKQLSEEVAAAQEERDAVEGQRAGLERRLAEVQLNLAQMEAQQEAFQSVQQRLSELETEQHSAAEWFDALTAELTDKAEQVAQLGLRLQAAEQQQAAAQAALESRQGALADKSAALAAAEVARDQAQAALGTAQQQLAEQQEQLETAEAMAADTSVQLVAAQEGLEGAQREAGEAQAAAQRAQHECADLQERLAAATARGDDGERCVQQLRRGLFFMAAVHEAAARTQAAAASEAACQYETAAQNQSAAASEAARQHEAALAAAKERHLAALAAAEEQLAAAARADEEQHRQLAAAACEAHQVEVAALQASLQQVSAELAEAAQQHQTAAQRCAALEAELAQQTAAAAGLQGQLEETKAEHAAAGAARVAAERRYQQAAADAATHERHAQQLEQQCGVLRQQLAFLHDQQQADTDATSALKSAVAAATGEADALRRQLAEAQQAAAGAGAECQRLHAAFEAASSDLQAAQQREEEVQARLAVQVEAADAAGAAAEQARLQAADAEAQAESLRRQLEEEEERRRRAEAELDEAAAERERLLARAQVHDAVEGLASRLQAQMQLLQRIEASVPAPGAPLDASQNGAGGLESRRQLLAHVLEKLQALKAENAQLWRMLEDHLASGGGGGGGGGALVQQQRPNQYVAHLESEREQLQRQLATAQREHAEEAARLAVAQAAVSKLQTVVQRLSAAGSGGWQAAGAVDAELLQAQLPALPAASPAAPVQHSGLSSSTSDAETWQAEKRLLKAICKLALAVTMDQVGGRQEAASLADELAPLMAANAAALRQLGLHKVWHSLHKLALAGGTASGAHQRQQASQAWAATPPVAAGPGTAPAWAAAELPADVQALQQRVREYKATVVAMEGAAARWQSQATEIEQNLAVLRFRLADLLSEVKWVLEDYSETDLTAGTDGEGPVSSQQLHCLVEELSKGLRRVLRRHRTLSAALLAAREEAQQAQQAQHVGQQAQRWDDRRQQPQPSWRGQPGEQEACSASQGSQGSQGSGAWAGHSSGGARPSASEAVLEAERRAVRVAEKLDRLLTPHSRAAVHGSTGPAGEWGARSRFASAADVQHAAGEYTGGAAGELDQSGGGGGGLGYGLGAGAYAEVQRPAWGVAADPAEELPLRQRYGGGSSSQSSLC